jgi:hypothetical protein
VRRTILIVSVLLAILAIGLSVWLCVLFMPNDGPRAMVVQVTGPVGVRVSASLDADGRSSTEELAVPCEFTATAYKLVFLVTKIDGPKGEIRVTMTADGRLYGMNSGLIEVNGHLEFDGRKQKVASISGR